MTSFGQDILLSAAIGTMLALVLALPAVAGELRRRHKGHFLLPDIHRGWGRVLSDREVFALGLLIHLGAGLVFGILYPIIVWLNSLPSLPAYGWGSVAAFGAIYYLVVNLVVFPAAHMGAFGWREDAMIWLETFVTMICLVAGYVFVTGWFTPSWFATGI